MSSAIHFEVLAENDDVLNLCQVDAKKSGNGSPSVRKSQNEVKFQYRTNQVDEIQKLFYFYHI